MGPPPGKGGDATATTNATSATANGSVGAFATATGGDSGFQRETRRKRRRRAETGRRPPLRWRAALTASPIRPRPLAAASAGQAPMAACRATAEARPRPPRRRRRMAARRTHRRTPPGATPAPSTKARPAAAARQARQPTLSPQAPPWQTRRRPAARAANSDYGSGGNGGAATATASSTAPSGAATTKATASGGAGSNYGGGPVHDIVFRAMEAPRPRWPIRPRARAAPRRQRRLQAAARVGRGLNAAAGNGGDATATADSTARGGGAATAVATATGGAAGSFFLAGVCRREWRGERKFDCDDRPWRDRAGAIDCGRIKREGPVDSGDELRQCPGSVDGHRTDRQHGDDKRDRSSRRVRSGFQQSRPDRLRLRSRSSRQGLRDVAHRERGRGRRRAAGASATRSSAPPFLAPITPPTAAARATPTAQPRRSISLTAGTCCSGSLTIKRLASTAGLGFQSMDFYVIADGAKIDDWTFTSLAAADSFFQDQVIDLGSTFGPDVGLTFGYNLVADGSGGYGFDLAVGGAVPETLDLGDDGARLRGAGLPRLSRPPRRSAPLRRQVGVEVRARAAIRLSYCHGPQGSRFFA